MITYVLPERPFPQLASDFAQLNDRNYLIMVDCHTDWLSFLLIRQYIMSQALITDLKNYFTRSTVANILWFDGGPQFRSQHSADFL